ncbi:MAG TPA: ABC transporter substrate-binding protein [Bacillota bacterium]
MSYKRFKKWGIFNLLLAFMIVFTAACGPANEEADKQGGDENPEEVTQNEEQSFPVTITDDANREVTIDEEPESIVSLIPSNTEILFALDLGDRIDGVSEYCDYPKEAQDIQQVGAQDMDAERILEILPDIIFVTDYHHENHSDILEQYEEAGIDVVVTGSASSFDDTYQTMEMIAEATGTTDKADEVISDMQERLDTIKEKAKSITDQKKVWVEVSPAPDIYTTGKNTFMHEMLESIQAINVAEDQDGWVKMTEEEIVQLNPEVIITTYGYSVDNPEEEVYQRDGWDEVPAVKNEQVFNVEDDTVQRPGPRLIEGVEALAELIYPEIFKE